jgi:hypothetical protein
MNHFLVVKVFDWKGTWHATADRVLPTDGTRVARRQRVWSISIEGAAPLTEFEAVSLAAEALSEVARQG